MSACCRGVERVITLKSQEALTLPIFSMTGFARAEGYDDRCSWEWEARSVNGKGLDVRCRLPSGFENLEQVVRERVKTALRRGNVTVNLNITRVQVAGAYQVNEDVLEGLVAMLPKLSAMVPGATPATLDGLLALKGVIEVRDDVLSDEARAELEDAVLSGLDDVLRALSAMRREEGDHLADVLGGQIDGIESLCDEAAKLAALQPETISQRLKKQVAALLHDIPELPAERLAQEAALLMTKADIVEELDRLTAHVAAARSLLVVDAAIGRKLDFLCQEFNREANTLCSKSADIELTRIGLDLKALIEQFREQVQNIE